MAQTITMGVPEEKNKSFFEVRMTKEGAQFMAVRGDIEVSGFTTSRTRSVVERIVERVMGASNGAPTEVSVAADKMVQYIETMVRQFATNFVSVSTNVKSGKAWVSLHVYLTYYEDEKVREWRGQVEAGVEGPVGRRSMGKVLVKKRVVFAKNVNGLSLYTALTEVAGRAYNAIVEEE